MVVIQMVVVQYKAGREMPNVGYEVTNGAARCYGTGVKGKYF